MVKKILIPIFSFFLGTLLAGVLFLKIYINTVETNLLTLSQTQFQYFQLYRDSPDKLESLLVREMACYLDYSLEWQDSIFALGAQSHLDTLKQQKLNVEGVGGVCYLERDLVAE